MLRRDCTDVGMCIQKNFYVCFYELPQSLTSTCKFSCKPMKCHNFPICKRELPKIVLEKHDGICPRCYNTIGKVVALPKQETCSQYVAKLKG